jgi:hypothetical protein
MDKTTALEILKLDKGASFEDAKKAYRTLAKEYHPDVAWKNGRPGEDKGLKMKEINLAFRYLVPLLDSGSTGGKERQSADAGQSIKKRPSNDNAPEGQPGKGQSGKAGPAQHPFNAFFLFLRQISGRAAGFFKSKGKGRAFKQTTESQKQAPKSPPQSSGKTMERTGRKKAFKDVLDQVHPGGRVGKTGAAMPDNKSGWQKAGPFCGYGHYMSLKQKIKSGRPGQHQGMGIGRIEKIKPVRPIRPVGSD